MVLGGWSDGDRACGSGDLRGFHRRRRPGLAVPWPTGFCRRRPGLAVFEAPAHPLFFCALKWGSQILDIPLFWLDFCRKNAYNHSDFTARTPQQYPGHRPSERNPFAGRVPLGPGEGQRRSGDGNVHGPLPVPEGTKEAQALNLGGTTKRERYRPKTGFGRTALFFELGIRNEELGIYFHRSVLLNF